MKLGGIIKTSMIDYPGKISCVVFTQGCNFHCPYCHNPDLIGPEPVDGGIDPEAVLAFLDKRKGLLDGVVITGGEPTLQKNLLTFCKQVKEKGFELKVDTNGSRPHVLKMLISEGLVDYIAMDIKTSPDSYIPLIVSSINPEDIAVSTDLIMNSGVQYEFRTTCVAPFTDEAHIHEITELIKGSDRYALQGVCQDRVLSQDFFNEGAVIETETLERFRDIALTGVKECLIR